MSDERHEMIRELLGAYALDAVDATDAVLVEAHLATCDECSSEVAHHHEMAAMLANTGGEAPAHLWRRIEAQIDAPNESAMTLVDLDDVRQTRDRALRNRGGGTRSWLAAAAAVIVLGAFIAEVIDLEGRVHQLQSASPQAQLLRAAQAALHDREARTVVLSSPAAVKLAQIAILPSGAAYLLSDDLPALPTTRTYQLWAEVGGRFVSMGLLGSHPSAIAFQIGAAKVASFALTDERQGGVVAPTHAPLAVGEA